jgi:pyruvate/2-oxoglutarate dehydrogenase complex dihydrolipoamide acyltransferase (E2) component
MTSVVAALQAALGAEHQAIFGYEMIGPRLGAASQGRARSAQAAHESGRDAVSALLAGVGVRPQPGEADYPRQQALLDKPRSVAVAVEDACAAAWRFAYAKAADPATPAEITGPSAVEASGSRTPRRGASAPRHRPLATSAVRALAQQGLIDSAVRATDWRRGDRSQRPFVAFPGT